MWMLYLSSILLLCTYSSAQSDHTLPENENILNNNNGKNLNPQAQRSFGHNPPITCPDKFRYEYDQHGVLYGRVTIQRDPYAKQFVFEVNMTVNAPVQQNDGLSIRLLSTQREILNGQYLQYAIIFPRAASWKVPNLDQLMMNRVVVCTGRELPLDSDGVQTAMWARSTISIDNTRPSPTPGPWGYPQIGYPNVGPYPPIVNPNVRPYPPIGNPHLRPYPPIVDPNLRPYPPPPVYPPDYPHVRPYPPYGIPYYRGANKNDGEAGAGPGADIGAGDGAEAGIP